jgi:nucleoside phosphorylase
MKRLPLREPPVNSCRVLAHFLEQKLHNSEREYLLNDFWWKAKDLPPEVGRDFFLQVLRTILPERASSLLDWFGKTAESTRETVDIAIITVIKEELTAAKIAFGIEEDKAEDKRVHGFRYWEATACDASGRNLRVVLTMVGEARNLPCAIACARLFDAYKVGACILVGIAAGLAGKVSLGDVVAAKLVLDYEGARMEPKGPAKRPQPYPLETGISRDLVHFDPKREWQTHFAQCLSRLKDSGVVPTLDPQWVPKYHTGVILAGEKLLADGRLPKMQMEYHEQVRAAEMEGSGFARACNEYAVPWLVFRGVSDFGDTNKPNTENWKTTAALSAATAAVAFLQTDYRPDTF